MLSAMTYQVMPIHKSALNQLIDGTPKTATQREDTRNSAPPPMVKVWNTVDEPTKGKD